MTRDEKIIKIVNCLNIKEQERIKEKTDEQLDYILSSINENIFLKACPGSGKTEVVGLKAAYEIQRWRRKPAGIAVITFTNNARDVINERITQFVGNNKSKYPHFVGTIDSWLHGYLFQPILSKGLQYLGNNDDYSIRITENSSESNFLYSFKSKYGIKKTGNILANQFFFDYETNNFIFNSSKQERDIARNSIELENYQIEDLKETKTRLWKAGFCTYEDIEQLCFKSLNHNNKIRERFAKRFPFIIIDECQDLSSIQLKIFTELMQAGTIIHIVGDLNQSIYEFKEVEPQNVLNFTANNKFKTMALSNNHRSCQHIVDTFIQIVNAQKTIGINKILLKKSCIYFSYKKKEIFNSVSEFEQYLNACEINLNKSVIITRNWNNVYHLRNIKRIAMKKFQYQLAMAIYLWQTTKKLRMEEAINLIGKFISKIYFSNYLSDLRKFYCPECVNSGISWRIFLANILDNIYKNESSIKNLNQSWKDWAKGVKSDLIKITQDCIEILNENISSETKEKIDHKEWKLKEFKAPRGDAVNNVLNTLVGSEVKQTNLMITTIHSVKGQTFDAVLVVSSPSKVGTTDGHWSYWLENPNSEAARLAYVASSRPKHLLAWAIPEPNEEEIKKIESLGFINYSET